jgi:cytochrome b subunit of formate dehydrogenase
VRFIYLWMIGLTIGGMTVHNVLDLSRKARRPPAPPRSLAVDQPERMARGLRWQHGLVMLSFPILVYTGFALKYPEAWWAAPLLRWERAFGLRGVIHRTAAVVMLVGLLWHVIGLVSNPRLRACMRQILPTLRDARVALGTFAYYLGRRAHAPHSGTFNYAEKAEYLAFMWGSGVMALTGFLLWFENTTLRYLPSWVPDIATAIHFYEAILATLSILVWHFYWVIFDPEVYPMDWTWWDGRPPESRVIERQPPANTGDGE